MKAHKKNEGFKACKKNIKSSEMGQEREAERKYLKNHQKTSEVIGIIKSLPINNPLQYKFSSKGACSGWMGF